MAILNELLSHANIPLQAARLQDCTASMFAAIFEIMFDTPLRTLNRNPTSQADHAANCQAVIDGLAAVLQMPLTHITGEAVVAGSTVATCNLDRKSVV